MILLSRQTRLVFVSCLLVGIMPFLGFAVNETRVDRDTILHLITDWQQTPGYDLTGDGLTDDVDLFYLQNLWRQTPIFATDIQPVSATLFAPATLKFTITSKGFYPDSVVLSVNDVPGGNADLGTIDAQGLYTPPSASPEPAFRTFTIEASAERPFPASGQARVTVIYPEARDYQNFSTARPVGYHNEPVSPTPLNSTLITARPIAYWNEPIAPNPINSTTICARSVGYWNEPIAPNPINSTTICARSVGYWNEPVKPDRPNEILVAARCVGYRNGSGESVTTQVTAVAEAVGYSNQ